jgi:hypothetical protein
VLSMISESLPRSAAVAFSLMVLSSDGTSWLCFKKHFLGKKNSVKLPSDSFSFHESDPLFKSKLSSMPSDAILVATTEFRQRRALLTKSTKSRSILDDWPILATKSVPSQESTKSPTFCVVSLRTSAIGPPANPPNMPNANTVLRC